MPVSEAPSRSTMHSTTDRRAKLCDKVVATVLKRARDIGLNVDMATQSYVYDEVNHLLQHGQLQEQDLHRMVQTIKSEQQRKAATMPSKAAASLVATDVTRSTRVRPESESAPRKKIIGADLIPDGDLHTMAAHVRSLPPLLQKRIMIQRQQGPWTEVIHQEIEEFNQDIRERQQRLLKQRAEQRIFLDMQIKRKEEEKVRDREQKRAQAREEEVQRQLWEAEEKAEVTRRRNETTLLAVDLKSQREVALRKKKEEVERAKLEEIQKVTQLQKEIKEEESEKKYKKTAVKQEIKEYLEYNKVQMALKDKEKEKVAEMDIKHLQEYEKKLELQEKERQQNLKQISERQNAQYNMANQRWKTWQEHLTKDEEKAEYHQRKIEAKLKAEEDEKKRRQNEEAQRVKHVVALQIAEKEFRKQQAKEESLQLREEVARNVARAEQIEARRRVEAKEFARQGLREIDKQLVELHAKRFQPRQIKVGERLESLKPLGAL